MRTVSVYRPLRWSHIALNSSMYTRWWKKKEEINYCSCARCISNLTTEENWLWLRRIEIFCLWARSNRHVVLILYSRCVHDFILFIQFFIAIFFSTRYAISRLRDAIQIHSQLWVQVVQLLARFDAVRTVGWIASEQWFFGHHRCIEDVIRNCQLLRFLVIIGCAMDGEQLHGDCMTASQPLLCWIHTF